MRRLGLLLLALCAPGCRPPTSSGPPDWAQVESLLAAAPLEERAKGIRLLFDVEEAFPGTLVQLAEMPDHALPGFRHYTAVVILMEARPAWHPAKRSLELLIGGLEDPRPLPVGGSAYWDLPIGRFCHDALQILTGEVFPPRPVNVMPSRAAVLQWRKWWAESQAYLCYEGGEGRWRVDPVARRLGIPVAEP